MPIKNGHLAFADCGTQLVSYFTKQAPAARSRNLLGGVSKATGSGSQIDCRYDDNVSQHMRDYCRFQASLPVKVASNKTEQRICDDDVADDRYGEINSQYVDQR
jgi:hypothetical protein